MTIPNAKDNDGIAENLRERRADWLRRIEELVAAAQGSLSIEGAVTLLKLVTACEAAGNAAHKEEKAPYLDGGRAVDFFFSKHSERLAAAKQMVIQILAAADGWGTSATLRDNMGNAAIRYEVWEAEISDPLAVPSEYLSPDMSKIKAAIKDGKVPFIPGVRIYSTVKYKAR